MGNSGNSGTGLIPLRNFSVLLKQNTEVGHGAVICLAQRRLPITREVDSVPIGEL